MRVIRNGRHNIIGRGVPVSELVNSLSSPSRPLLDKTGLTGKYDFNLEYALSPAEVENLSNQTGRPVAAEPGLPDLATALQEQLGLKLEPKKGLIEILVIDHAEKAPTEN
jgi:uncharacterized protein (TIGR03435 family)